LVSPPLAHADSENKNKELINEVEVMLLKGYGGV
jgi:hypothetical protein